MKTKLFNNLESSEEQYRLALSLTCINNCDDSTYETEDAPNPSYKRNTINDTEKSKYHCLVGIELKIIGTLSVNLAAVIRNDKSEES